MVITPFVLVLLIILASKRDNAPREGKSTKPSYFADKAKFSEQVKQYTSMGVDLKLAKAYASLDKAEREGRI